MESKYKERAIFMAKEWDIYNYPSGEVNDDAVDALVQLAEEVEVACDIQAENTRLGMYTKNQVEALLQKQRELCVTKVKQDAMESCGSDIPDCWSEDSILNAKLILE